MTGLGSKAMTWVAISVWTIGSCALAWFMWKQYPGTDGQTLAAWFQAVGSIAAIFVAFLIGREQSNAALRAVTDQQHERRKSITAVAGAAAEHARRIGDALEQDGIGHVGIYGVYDQTIVDGVVHALTNAPAHEVGTPEGVIALLMLRDQFVFLGVAMEKYLKGPEQLPEFKQSLDACADDLIYRRGVVETGERVLKGNVRGRLDQIRHFHNQLLAAVERSR